jgi:peroxiredoxin
LRGRFVGGSALLVAGIVFAVLLLSQPGPDPVRAGQPAPGFDLPRLEGGNVSLAALRGRVVLVNFWATWCAPCESEMPAMQRLYEAVGGPDFELVAVSVDASREDVLKFRDRLKLGFPIALDPSKHVAESYQTFRYPESYLIDRDGRILARYVGPRDWDSEVYEDHIRQVIAGAAGTADGGGPG